MSLRWAESALSWWEEAGVDTVVGEQPRNWLATPAPAAAREAEPAPAPAVPFPDDLPAFQEIETSAENQARYLFDELRARAGAVGEHLLYVRVWETPNQWAQYSERPMAW